MASEKNKTLSYRTERMGLVFSDPLNPAEEEMQRAIFVGLDNKTVRCFGYNKTESSSLDDRANQTFALVTMDWSLCNTAWVFPGPECIAAGAAEGQSIHAHSASSGVTCSRRSPVCLFLVQVLFLEFFSEMHRTALDWLCTEKCFKTRCCLEASPVTVVRTRALE
jgi:hypothetical protein